MKALLVLLSLCCATALTACTQKQDTAATAVSATQSLVAKQVSRMEIAKIDSLTGDRWTATLEKKGPRDTDWEIVSASVDKSLKDRRANGTFILHLLDSITSLSSVGDAPKGPLESFGLQPPRFAIRWTQAGATSEIQMGTLASGRGQTGVYALLPGQKEVQIIRGTTLKLLDLIQGFESIRQRRWSTIDADEVDEIELKPMRKKTLYAQRAGTDWQDKSGKPVTGEINAWLEKLTSMESIAILDQENAADFESMRELTLKDRKGLAVVFRIRKDTSKPARILGMISTRPEVVFQLPDQAWSLFDGF